MSKHTPAPWRSEGTRVTAKVGKRRVVVATIPNSGVAAIPVEQRRPNAQLIGAAPDLLAVLDALVAWHLTNSFGAYGTELMPVVKAARAAIAKAKGGQG